MTSDVLNKIASSLDVSVQDVKDMNTRLKSHDGSLNTLMDNSGDSGSERMDFIADTKPNQEDVLMYSETLKHRKALFFKSLIVLNKREKDILFKRRLSEKAVTLDDLSKFYNISKERVRQIELNSIKKIKKAVDAELC
jgi:RNA polymerase sigma-32 factor